MTDTALPSKTDSVPDPHAPTNKKKPYMPPTWEEQPVLETAALACAKADDAGCGAGPITS